MSSNGYRPKVLVTDGGGGQARSTLATVRALALGGYAPWATTSAPHSLAAASRFCEGAVTVPPVDAPGYAAAVQEELETGGYLTVLCASDAALIALGADVAALVDKASLATEADSVGIKAAPGRTFQNLEEIRAADMRFPVVVKSLALGQSVRRIVSASDLERLKATPGPFLVQPYLEDTLRAVAGVIFDGRLVASIHQRCMRTWPPDCGGASAAETVEPDYGIEQRLLSLLDGFEGVFQAQFAGDYLLDLNPRVYGSLPLAVKAKANLAAIFCDCLRGLVPASTIRAETGVFFRWLEGDVRNVLESMRSGGMSPRDALSILRPVSGAAHGPESLLDPKPMLTRLVYAARSGRLKRDGLSSLGTRT